MNTITQPNEEYVVGFLFKDVSVALIKKARPKWQAGMWNGIGGKVELGEEPKQAMMREFHEETGAHVDNWRYDRTVVFPNGAVLHYYYAFGGYTIKTITDEKVDWKPINRLPVDMLNDARQFIYYVQTVATQYEQSGREETVGDRPTAPEFRGKTNRLRQRG